MTSVVISQPMFFPWPGFLEQMMLADVFLWLDDAQFSRGSFTNRTRIPYDGDMKWLSIPLAGRGSFQLIRDLAPAEDFRGRHVGMLKQAFAKAPFRKMALDVVDEVYAHNSICDLLIASAEVPAMRIGLAPPKRRALTSATSMAGTSWERVLEMVLHYDGDRYVTGHGASNYLNHEAFENKGVRVEYMAYSKTPWPRQGGPGSVYASVLDLIAHTGEAAASYLHPATSAWRDFLQNRESSGDALTNPNGEFA